jgi:hypothetical protein
MSAHPLVFEELRIRPPSSLSLRDASNIRHRMLIDDRCGRVSLQIITSYFQPTQEVLADEIMTQNYIT